MIGFINSLVGNVYAKESSKEITLYGFDGTLLAKEISKVWRTTRIAKYIFTKASRNALTFHKFFLLDIIYTLEQINKQRHVYISRRSIEKAINELKELTDLRTVFNDESVGSIVDKSKLSKFNVSPLDWQKEYIDIYSDRLSRYKLKGHLLAAAPGSGKTIGSLFVMEAVAVDTLFVICPKNAVIDVWQETFESKYKQKPNYWHSLQGKALAPGYDKYILHYEYLPKLEEFLNKQPRGQFKKVGLILDECHNFNDIKSMRTQSLIEITTKFPVDYSLWMSGTPLKAFGKECVPLMSCIDPIFDSDCRDRFIGVFGNASDRALDILANRIGIISHKVEKKEVMDSFKMHVYHAKVKLDNGKEYTLDAIREKVKDFVTKRTIYYKQNEQLYKDDYFEGIDYYRDRLKNQPIKLKELDEYLAIVEKIRKGYDPVAMKDDSIYCNNFEKKEIIPNLPNDLKKSFRKAKSVYKYVQLTIMGEALGSVLGKLRTKCNVDIANNLGTMQLIAQGNAPELGEMTLEEIIVNAEKKTLMFSSFVEVVTSLSTKLIKEGYNPLMVYGATNSDLPKIVSKYENDDTANPLIATYQSLSSAVPLTMANTVFILNSPFREHEYKQAVARAYRKGQDKDVVVIEIYLDTGSEDNISTRSKDIADETAAIVAKIMGYDKVDLSAIANEAYSEETCISCKNSSVYSGMGQVTSNDHTQDGFAALSETKSSGSTTSEVSVDTNGPKQPYYKTDITEDRLKTIADITKDDFMWDDEDSKTILYDLSPRNEKLTSYATGENRFYDW